MFYTSCFPADTKSVYKKIQLAFNRMNSSSFGCLWECPQLLELWGKLVDTSKLDSNINSVVNVVTHSWYGDEPDHHEGLF